MRKISSILLCIVMVATVITVSVPVNGIVIEDGLVSHWRFDEWRGNTAEDFAGGNDGTLVNGPEWSQGNVNGALSFDGVDDYVDFGDPDWAHNTGTIAAWIKPYSTSTNMIVSITDGDSTSNYFQFYTDSNVLWWQLISQSVGGSLYCTLIVDGNWHHVAVTQNGTTASLYVDGALQPSITKGTVNTWLDDMTGLSDYRIGNTIYNNEDYNQFDGKIDEVMIWNRALDQDEISEVYNLINDPVADTGLDQTVYEGDMVELDGSDSRGSITGFPTPPEMDSNLVALWHMDENQDDIIHDETSNDNDGMIYGSDWADGKSGKALSFDGIEDYVNAGSDSSLDITQGLTIEAWVKLSGLSRPNSIISKGSYSLKIGPDNKAIFSARNSSTGEDWTEPGDLTDMYICSFAIFNGYLYAGTGFTPAKIYRSSDGTTWTEVKNTGENYVFSLAVFNDYLYAGTANNGKIYRSSDGTTWTIVEDTVESSIHCLAVFKGCLYAGTSSNGRIYRSGNGTTWTEVEDTTETDIHSLGVFNGYLYAGTEPNGKIYRSNDGTTWIEVEDTTENKIISFAVFDGYLYAGTALDGKIYRSNNGTTWTEVEDTAETYILSLAVFNGYLYAGAGGSARIYRSSDGTTWTMVEDTGQTYIFSLAVFNGYLYAGSALNGKIYRMGGGFDLYSNNDISLDEWTHIAGTYDGSTAKIYLNGILDQQLITQITIDTNTLNLLIGNSYGSTAGGYSSTGEENHKGLIDEVRLYNRALNATEVQEHYESFILTVQSNKTTYSPSDQVTLTANYTGENAPTNVTFRVEYPDGTTMLEETEDIDWEPGAWTKYDGNPVLTHGANGDWDDYSVSGPSVLYMNGIYKMWYSGYEGGPLTGKIGYATSNDGINWNKCSENPVLTPSSSESWDDTELGKPHVIYNGEKYIMYYSALTSHASPHHWRIGAAYSDDGINWTKYSLNPVIDLGTTGSWDDGSVFGSCVIYEGGIYHMWYGGSPSGGMENAEIGYATSYDGFNWTKYDENPILLKGQAGSWDNNAVVDPSVIFYGMKYYMFYRGVDGTNLHQIGYTISDNGIDWVKYQDNPILSPGISGSWDEYAVCDPLILKIDEIFNIWYRGVHPPSPYYHEIGLATAPFNISRPGTTTLTFTLPLDAPPHTYTVYASCIDAVATTTFNVIAPEKIVSYEWDFESDGIYDYVETPESAPDGTFDGKTTHTYEDNGINIVTLRVTDEVGASDIDTCEITVLNVAPMITSITAPIDPIPVGTAVPFSAIFTDPGILDTHTAIWNWGDESESPGTVIESDGSGTVNDTHEYNDPGVYTIGLTVIDNDGDSGYAEFKYVVIYDPEGGFVTGGGWIYSPRGAYYPDPELEGKANFGFVSKYKKGAMTPTGNTEFNFDVAEMNFHSTYYEWLVIAGARAQFKGSGTINGSGNYGFLLTAIDGDLQGMDGIDRLRIKIWDKDNNDMIIYDNGAGIGDNEPFPSLGGGEIVIHNPNK